MPSNSTKYAVDVLLNPESFPTSDQSVIWDTSEGSFALGDAPGGGGTTYSQDGESQITHTVIFGSNAPYILASPTDDHILVGEFYGAVADKSRYQMSRVVIGWVNDATTPQFKISVVEDVRFPAQKVIYNINGWGVAWHQSNTALLITVPQYTMGTTSAQEVDYRLNFRTF
tara:strand:+ start:1266 stop:1778 length:513 start_codon:yes stop_codon:yes gene_type:complete